jgi:hypothetical protein
MLLNMIVFLREIVNKNNKVRELIVAYYKYKIYNFNQWRNSCGKL